MKTSSIVKAVIDLGHLATPHYLGELGYSQAKIERAVKNNLLAWRRDGHLEIVEPDDVEQN